MQLPPNIRGLVDDPRVRLGLVIALASIWFLFVLTIDAGRNAGFNWLYAAPSAMVIIWWRSRPWTALGLALTTLVIVLFGAVNGSPVYTGGVTACATAWLAIFGAFSSRDQQLRWAAVGLAIVDAVLGLGYGNFIGFVLVAFFTGMALVAAWYRRERQVRGTLVGRLHETEQRGEAAERDVLLELERNRIAREVHDVVAHSLAVVIAQADGARFAAELKPESVAPALEAISDTARRALGEVRTMLHDLRASGEAGVVPGPEDLAGLIAGIRALDVDVDEASFGEAQPLDERTGLALYRVAQEALTNAMRHGDRAEPVGFELDWGEREVVLVVTNAVPGEAVPATERNGHGIQGMRERASGVEGDCSAGVGSNGRFRLRVALPIPLAPVADAAAGPANPMAALFGPLAEPRA